MIRLTTNQIISSALRLWSLIDQVRENQEVTETLYVCRGQPLCLRPKAPCDWCARVAKTDDRPISTIACSLVATIH